MPFNQLIWFAIIGSIICNLPYNSQGAVASRRAFPSEWTGTEQSLARIKCPSGEVYDRMRNRCVKLISLKGKTLEYRLFPQIFFPDRSCPIGSIYDTTRQKCVESSKTD
ncbi:hypothetical protein CHUAL_001838 [Chamberlinius hualienensis]